MSPTADLAPAGAVHLTGGPGWAADVVAETATPNPSDDPLRPELEPTDVSPGLIGFLAIFAVALATVGLFFALSRQLRRMRHNADAQGIGPDGPLDPAGSTGEGAAGVADDAGAPVAEEAPVPGATPGTSDTSSGTASGDEDGEPGDRGRDA